MTKRILKFILIASLINGAIMVLIAFFMLNQPMVRGDERELIKKTTSFKNLLTGKDTSGFQKFLFLNVSHDKELIGYLDKNGFPEGNQPITDRKKVGDLVAYLNRNRNAFLYLFTDIYFIDESPNDSLLGSELGKMGDKAIIPFHLGEEKPKFGSNQALADYIATESTFVKFKLTQTDPATGKFMKSVPLVMSEKINGVTPRKGGFLFYLNNKPAFNNFIISLRITKDDLDQKRCDYMNLGSFLNLPEERKMDHVKNRIIVAGDFEDKKNDFHKTVDGSQPGSLLLVNAYLAIAKGDNLIPALLFPLLYLGFFLISLLVFYPVNIFEEWIAKITAKIPSAKAAKYVAGFISYTALLSILSTLCFLLFNIHVNVLYLTVYIYGLEKVIAWVNKKLNLGFRYERGGKD